LTAQRTATTIDEESKVPKYILPELLKSDSGKKIETQIEWERIRRPEILEHFAGQMYGKIPGTLPSPEVRILEEGTLDIDNKAIRKQVQLAFKHGADSICMNILIYTPNKKLMAPVFMGYNFAGNYLLHNDPFILIDGKKENELSGDSFEKFKTQKRGERNSRWAIEKIIESGYGLVTLNYNDVDPDKNDFSDGIHSLLHNSYQIKPEDDQWGSISAWAWGLSRVMDYFVTETLIDENKVILFGHSRLGKTSLWAGALDQRFSIVISNNSGCGGAALSRRRFGEKVSDITTNLSHWFAKNFQKYSENESSLPIDQHMLIALIAPRPVYVASASKDSWADPRGEFISAKQASKVYKLYGMQGIELYDYPKVNTPIHQSIGYHLRDGKHDVTVYDWKQYIKFANMHLN
jgi:hypothetical protein